MGLRGATVSLLRLTEEDVDVMVVTLLFPVVLSNPTSVPLVDVLDREALPLAISPKLVPIIVANNRHRCKKCLFQPYQNFQPKTRMVYEVCNLLQLQRAALKLLSIKTEETAWGRKTSHGGVRHGIFGSNFQF